MSTKLNRLKLVKSQGWEDSSIVLLAQIRGSDRDLIQQADISSISYEVTDLSDSSNVDGPAALTVSSVVIDTPVTDDVAWLDAFPGDTTGYNFEYVAPKTWFPDADRTYRIEIIFTPAAGATYDFAVVFEHKTKALYKS